MRLPGQVLYEMHIGTFTPEGTWAAAARELPFVHHLLFVEARTRAAQQPPRDH